MVGSCCAPHDLALTGINVHPREAALSGINNCLTIKDHVAVS